MPACLEFVPGYKPNEFKPLEFREQKACGIRSRPQIMIGLQD